MSFVRPVLAGLFIIVLLLFATVAISSVQDGRPAESGRHFQDAAILPGDNSFVSLDSGNGTDETVYETTGFGVNLTGTNDSYVQSSSGVDIASDQSWTVSAWGYVESGQGSDNMSLVSADGRVIITFNGTAGNWSAWYYDDGSRNSHIVNVSTSGNETGNYTNVMAWANGSHFSIFRNNTQGDVVNLSTESIVDAPVEATNWAGRIDEVRTFDDALDSSQRSSLVNSAAEELPGPNVTARAMFDQPNASQQLLFYTSADLEQSNVTFSQGIPEDIQTEGTDYEWDHVGPDVRAISGGDLDGAPVVYATYDFDSPEQSLFSGWGTYVEIAALVPLLLVAFLLIRTLT